MSKWQLRPIPLITMRILGEAASVLGMMADAVGFLIKWHVDWTIVRNKVTRSC